MRGEDDRVQLWRKSVGKGLKAKKGSHKCLISMLDVKSFGKLLASSLF